MECCREMGMGGGGGGRAICEWIKFEVLWKGWLKWVQLNRIIQGAYKSHDSKWRKVKNLPIELENTTQGHLFHVIIYHTFGTLEISKLPACHFRPLNTHCYSICLTPLVFFLFANAKKDGTHHANGYEFSFQPIRANFSTNFRRGKYPSTSIVIQSTYLFSLPRTALRMAPPSSLFSLYLSPSPSSRNVQIQGGSFKMELSGGWQRFEEDKD